MLGVASERRRHVVYITRNSEYHCRGGQCVAVRSRITGSWHRWHLALRREISGAVRGHRLLRDPQPGLRLFFGGRDPLLTSQIEQVARPNKRSLAAYISQTWTGQIEAAT
ncbi:MAG: hypothetical protein H6707_05515 [Deltaproteobacteria bacterium]|nr:hypothetical protein [Deltaproteobacteria bacterium]